MDSSHSGNDENWLKDFIAGAIREVKHAESPSAATPLPPAWLELIDGPAPGESIDPIGPYQIVKRLGRGGMGVVFQAFDSTLRRVVAVKFLSPRLAVSSLARARFTREAQAAAALNHPNVVTIHAIGEHEGLPYMVMEYVAGLTLDERLEQEGVLQVKSILRIGIQIARGLAAAHAQGLVHRDIKPANILLEIGIDRVKISDFGLACVTAEPWRLTASGILLGTPPYMSPEQARGSALDHRSDLFSLGSVLYHLCTGERPFPGPNVNVILTHVRDREPRPIRDLNPDIPRVLENHIARLMAKNPADRFASADELALTLSDFLAEIQGTKPDQPLDDPVGELRDAAPPPEADRGGKFEIVDDWDDLASTPLSHDTPHGSAFALGESLLSHRTLKVVGLAAAGAMAAIAMISGALWLLSSTGENRLIVLLVALGFFAVFTWCFVQLRTVAGGDRVAEPPRRRPLKLLRNLVAAVALVVVSSMAFWEWSARAQATRALALVNARLGEKREGDRTRGEIEALIGRAAIEAFPGDDRRNVRVVYRWKGVFRTHQLHAEYRRDLNPRKGDTASDVLIWISDTLDTLETGWGGYL
jgi:serine/threonine protein kinase